MTKPETDMPTCPNCGSHDWDWTYNDNAECRDCGARFIARTDDTGAVTEVIA